MFARCSIIEETYLLVPWSRTARAKKCYYLTFFLEGMLRRLKRIPFYGLTCFIVNGLKWSINGCSFQILQTSVSRNHRQTLSQCQSHARTRNLSTRASVKWMTYREQMILSSKASPGRNSRTRRFLRIMLRSRSTSPKKIKYGSISEKILQKQRHNSRRIQQSLATTPRVISWIPSQKLSPPYQDSPSPHHTLQPAIGTP